MMIETFNKIYDSGQWGHGSGPGSNANGLKPYKEFLAKVICERNVRSIVDCGCGYFEPYADFEWGDLAYTGIDASHLVYVANQHYATEKRNFVQADFLQMILPEADLVLCKDVLQHWSDEDVFRGLERLKQFQLALITNTAIHGPELVNGKIETGGFRPLNLLQFPFYVVPIDWDCYKVITNEQDMKVMILVRNK